MATPDDYRGFEMDKIEQSPVLLLAWDLCQIMDDDAPLRWHRHVSTARCLLGGYQMTRTGFR